MVTLGKWKTDIPDLDEDIWEKSVSSYIPSMIASRDLFIQYKIFAQSILYPRGYTPPLVHYAQDVPLNSDHFFTWFGLVPEFAPSGRRWQTTIQL